MWTDPIVEEVRAARDAYAKKFGYDLVKIARDLQKKHPPTTTKSPARKTASKKAPTKAAKRTGKPKAA